MSKAILLLIVSLVAVICASGCINQSTISNATTNIGALWNNSKAAPKPDINMQELELQIHNLINTERQNNGLASLSWDDNISGIARAHSQDMALHNFFDHINPDGQDPTARGEAAGYYCHKDYGSYYTDGLAENIFQNNLYTSVTYYNDVPVYNWSTQEQIAESTVSGWMNSSGHRHNILTATYDREGIGIAISSDDKVYITEDFC